MCVGFGAEECIKYFPEIALKKGKKWHNKNIQKHKKGENEIRIEFNASNT